MLRQDVVDACRDGRFCVYAVDTVDQALALLMGMPAGERDDSGAYPENSVNGKVEARLLAFAAIQKELAQPPAKDSEGGNHG
ncbi:hypothetical protein [Methylogaea oryzae]|nr:hypothetical protein [Methylogaea oryzae]